MEYAMMNFNIIFCWSFPVKAILRDNFNFQGSLLVLIIGKKYTLLIQNITSDE